MESDINKHGCWLTVDDTHHMFDSKLCDSIIDKFIDTSPSTIDIGCGTGDYTKALNLSGIKCVGYDGNLNTKSISGDVCNVLDFAIPQDVGKFELVMALEVGEHIPEECESVFIDNLVNASSKYVLVSWGLPNQPGFGHVNCKLNEYIIEEFNKRGFDYDKETSTLLREESEFWWFKQTILFFIKK